MNEGRKGKKKKIQEGDNLQIEDVKGETNDNSAKPDEKKFDQYQKYRAYQIDKAAYENGPVGDEKRTCRDCLCCIIFIAFLLGCGFVGFIGFREGRPKKLLYTYDEDANACGYDEGFKEYPLLYFYNVVGNLKKIDIEGVINGICVKECPSQKIDSGYIKLDCKPTKNNPECKVDKDNYYPSKGLLNRICFPSDYEESFDPATQQKIQIYDSKNREIIEKVIEKSMLHSFDGHPYVRLDAIDGNGTAVDASNKLINLSFFSTQKLSSYISDVILTKWAIVGSVIWSIVIALIFLLFLRCCAGVIVFIFLMAILAGLVILAIYFKMKESEYKETGDSTNKTLMTVLFWVCVALAALWLLFLLIMCNKIRLAVALIQVTAKYIHNNCCILFVPLVFFVLSIIWIGYWVLLLVYLLAAGDFNKEKSKVVAVFDWNDKIRYTFIYHVFALLYVDAVISAYSQFVYASSAAIWYFTQEKDLEKHPIAKSFYRGIRYHFGSLAFGALIIAIIRFIMLCLEYLKKKMESTVGGNTKVGKCFKCVICCFQCCLSCIGRTMEFINKHAYIQIALKGDNFCRAALDGFSLIIKHIGRFAVFASLGKIFEVLGTLFISTASGVIGYYVITKISYFSVGLNSAVLPVFIFAFIGLIIGLVTMSVYGTSGDAFIHCFLLDEEIHKGQPKSFPDLQKFMDDES